MQGVVESIQVVVPQRRPSLDSFDSSEECSLYHWEDVCRLVDEACILSADAELDLVQEIENVLEEAPSEVEPSTAYQHFAGNVV